ncbi:hypothetical protein [Corallococcus aberystwythensis]|uniref:Secreted protein n=1 Tax=Corallococcus aberystwythensis TaxID=2316722 RepID=A0A3A8QX95_9BACT|nr:hypothetical protein [Corallococcus aberystwythensis]RKH71560.1 hypothetical protein D7W81_07265 [Corallococcus aberystwythensis]
MSSLRALALLAALSLAPSTAGAAPEEPVPGMAYVFATVDAYSVAITTIDVTGTLQGESTPRTFRFWVYSGMASATDSVEASRCDRLALLSLTRPGRYLLTLSTDVHANFPTCTLTRQ